MNLVTNAAHRNCLSLALFGMSILISGCNQSLRGAPEPRISASPDILAKVISFELNDESLRTATGASASPDHRNRIIFARLAELDGLYYDFERSISFEGRQFDLIAALAGLGAGVGGTLATGGASQGFSVASTIIAGTQTAFNEKILADRTVQALASQMRANRDRIKAEIFKKLEAPINRYPLSAALSDLELYRQGGTLAGAIFGISESARIAENTGRDQLRDVQQRIGILTVERVTRPTRAPEVFERPNRDRISALRSLIRDTTLVSDEQILAFVNNLPPDFDRGSRTTLQTYATNGRFDQANLARHALGLAIFDGMTPQAVTAIETALLRPLGRPAQ
jgi:hypothetical protein